MNKRKGKGRQFSICCVRGPRKTFPICDLLTFHNNQAKNIARPTIFHTQLDLILQQCFFRIKPWHLQYICSPRMQYTYFIDSVKINILIVIPGHVYNFQYEMTGNKGQQATFRLTNINLSNKCSVQFSSHNKSTDKSSNEWSQRVTAKYLVLVTKTIR